MAITAGTLEVAGNGFYIIAARTGFLSLVRVLGSLAPLATVVLGRAVLAERMRAAQAAALFLAMIGIAMIAAG